MLKKLMIRTWAGPLPDWTWQFTEHVKHLEQYGWTFQIINLDTMTRLAQFNQRVLDRLYVRVDPGMGSRKICEFDPALATIFPESVSDYDFWGHFNLDCVYGRLDRWFPDSFLDTIDIYGDDPHQVCGPFTLYRNTPKVNYLFQDNRRWRDIFEHPDFAGFDEGEFSDTVRIAAAAGKIRFRSGSNHSHDKIEGHREKPHISLLPDGTLLEFGTTETMFFHFNQYRQWPIQAS